MPETSKFWDLAQACAFLSSTRSEIENIPLSLLNFENVSLKIFDDDPSISKIERSAPALTCYGLPSLTPNPFFLRVHCSELFKSGTLQKKFVLDGIHC